MAGKATAKFEGGEKLDRWFRGALKGGVEGVEVGFFASAKYPDGTPVAAVAAWNEFGTGTTPERPFFRNAIENVKPEVLELLKAEVDPLTMAVTPQIARRVGARVASEVKQEITRLRRPPNAPVTVEGGWMRSPGGKPFKVKGKKTRNPLIDTGVMRQSVTWRVDE